MTGPHRRLATGRHAIVGVLVGAWVAGCSMMPPSDPRPTQVVAARTAVPTSSAQPSPAATQAPEATIAPTTSPSLAPAPPSAPPPSLAPPPSSAPAAETSIVPGAVNRSSLFVRATYRVNAAIAVRTGALDVTTLITARNDSDKPIDRLDLNTIAARVGAIRVTAATVDEAPVKVTIRDQTLRVPLGGILPVGASTTVRIAYRATLRAGEAGSDWMFSRAGGTLALYRWIPWVSKDIPFNRPNQGEPFVTPTSPRVDVEILTDERMVLAGPAATIETFEAGRGNAWSFTVRDVRDVSVVLAPDFRITRGEANGIPILAYTRPGGLSGEQLVRQAADALRTHAGLLGVAYPWSVLAVVETRGGFGLESPGLAWIPVDANALNRTYLVYQETAHQWFYGLVGNDQRAEPFADEGPADLLARTALGTLRPSRCARDRLDKAITGYALACYYEVVLVQGGGVLEQIRRQMGSKPFWAAMGSYLEANRFGLAGTRQLLETLRKASKADLLPTLRARFPGLY